MGILLWWSGSAASATPCVADRPEIVINEWLANPPSVDTDLEWVELYNPGQRPIDLSGWFLASGTSVYGASVLFPVGSTIDGGEYLVVVQSDHMPADIVAPGFALGNASADADALQLVDCNGAPVDTLVYGAPNDDGWLDDGGTEAISLGPAPPEGETLGRRPDGVDTDRAGDDLIVLPYPSPGRSNDAPPETCGGPGSGLVVNEIFPDPEGADDGGEWIELYHAGNEILDLVGWSVETGTSSPTERYTWTEGTIRPGDRLVIGGPGLAVDGFTLGNASTNADIVRVVDCLGFASDTLIYGTVNDDGFLDDAGEPAESLAPVPGTGTSVQRRADGIDTDRCGDDFVIATTPTPGAANVTPASTGTICPLTLDGIVLNELFVDPEGADDGREWIELYNATDRPRGIAGWTLTFATTAFGDADLVFGELVLPAHGFLLVGGASVDGRDLTLETTLPNGTGTDGVLLSDCFGAPVDTVLYGTAPNRDGIPDDLGGVPDPYGAPGPDRALARVTDGRDDDRAEDWWVTGLPTPGASNRQPAGAWQGDAGPGGCTGPPGSGSAESHGCATGHGSPLPLVLVLALPGVFARRRQILLGDRQVDGRRGGPEMPHP